MSDNPQTGNHQYPPSPVSMSMEDQSKKKGRRTFGQKILMFAIVVAAVVFGFVLMAANSNRTIRESQSGEQSRKPLISDPTTLENDLLAAAEALKYRQKPQEEPSMEIPPPPENRIVMVRPPEKRIAEPRVRMLTDEEREAARKYRDMQFNALMSKSRVDGFQDAGKDGGSGQENPLV